MTDACIRLGTALVAQGCDADADRATMGRRCARDLDIPDHILIGASDEDVTRWAAMGAIRERDRGLR